MSSAKHDGTRRIIFSVFPAFLVIGVGIALAFSRSAEGQALIIGGVIAIPLIAAGSIIPLLCAGARGGLAIFSVLAPFIIRLAGAAITLGFTLDKPHAVYLVGGLVGALAISLFVDLVTAVKATLREPVRV